MKARGGLILGIETSCDETAAAVVADGSVVCSNVVASQVELHAPYGGVYPEVASRQHVRDILPVVERALSDADTDIADLDAIAVTRGPGLSGALLVGVNVAKGLSLSRGLPLFGVNHLEGHLYSNWLHEGGRIRTPADLLPDSRESSRRPPEELPYLALIVSGGHTELVWVTGRSEYERLGGTLDDAAGEAFDKVARLLGLGYPGGPAIERCAESGDPTAFEFPVGKTASPFDFSFSGLKTAALRTVERLQQRGEDLPLPDLAASFQAALVRALVERALRAAEDYECSQLHLSGGVSANRALRRALTDALPCAVRFPPPELCTDNAAMIAAAAYWLRASERVSGLAMDVVPGLRL